MGTQTFRYLNEKYTKEAIKDLKEMEEINDLEERLSRTNFYLEKHLKNFKELKDNKPEEHLGYFPYSDLDIYEKEIKKLKKFQSELLQKSGKIRNQKQKEQWNKENELKRSHCAYCKKKQLSTNHYIYSKQSKQLKQRKRNASLFDEWLFCSENHFEKWHKKNYFTCTECLEENYTGKYKKLNQKFCSDNCYYTHYAEKCDNCYEKCLKYSSGKATGHAQTYYNDGINKTGILCSKCHQVQLKEEREEKKKDQEWEETCKRDLVDEMVDEIAKGKENEDLDDSEINDEEDNNKSKNPISAWRERQQSLLHYFTTNNIQSITLTNNKLIIKYNHKEEEEEPKTKELQQIKDYLQKKSNNKLTLAELEQKTKGSSSNSVDNKNKSDKTALIIGGGIVGIFALLLIFILAKNHQKRKLKK